MKDNRLHIPKGTKIEYGKKMITVSEVIGQGGSCIVYDAFYTDIYGIQHDCILKQLHPIRQNVEWNKVEVSKTELERFMRASAVQKTIGIQSDTINSTSLLYDVFSYRDSVYFQLSEKNFGNSLDRIHFDSINDYLFILLQTAKIIGEYHKQGWLHLDIKPQNIFCKTDSNSYTVTMFDFDSMIKTDTISDSSNIISCSRDYAPPEILHLQRNKIGIASDFYEIGCMLFEKIFDRFPKSIEISGFTKYPFSESILHNCHNPELLASIQDFFKHTITVNVSSRYSSDSDFIHAIENLYSLSKLHQKNIISNFTTSSTFFIGRDNEIYSVRQKLLEKGKVIIEGVGGIGKSSLALHYADSYKNDYQTILYLEYHGSFDEFFENDIQINGISKTIPLKEKKEIFRELCNDKTLVILDNLNHTGYENFSQEWLSLPCHLVVTSRSSQTQYHDITLSLSGLDKAKELFYHYYTYPCSENEQEIINNLLYIIDSHAMMTELLGKFCYHYQAEHKYSNFEKVYDAFKILDTRNLGSDRVKQVKDWLPQNHPVQKHMDILFVVFEFDNDEIHLLQFMSLLNLKAISKELMIKWYGNDDSPSLVKLIGLGMIQYQHNDYKIHPLISERVLYNYPPYAENFIFTTEKIADSLLFATRRNRNILMTVSENYTRHLCGTDRSLGFLYQSMVSQAPKKQQKTFTDKALKIFSQIDNKCIPYFFRLKKISDKYSVLSWFDDEQEEQKKTLIDNFETLCKKALQDDDLYRIVQNCRQNAEICKRLAEEDVTFFDTEKEKIFYLYQVKFLEKALENCNSDSETKKIASLLYDCYTDILSPVENAVKAEKYRAISDTGVKFYDLATHQRIEKSEQERTADMIEALRMENQNEECLKMADLWYNKHINEKIPLDNYLCFLMECLYEENHLWEKYFTLIQEEADTFDDKLSLQLGKACYYQGMYDKAIEYLIFSEQYYAPKYSSVLNSDSENYLLTLGYLSACNENTEENLYGKKFFSCAKKYYETSLMKTSDEIAEFCFEMCKKFLKVLDREKAVHFLKLYARFKDSICISESEYSEFNSILEKIDQTDKNFFWIRLLQADYLENSLCSEDALEIYHSILDSMKNEGYYSQLIYQRIESCDYEDFTTYFLSNINYEMLYEMEQQGEEHLNFDESIGKRLEIVHNYEKIGSSHSKEVLQQIIADVGTFDGDKMTYAKTLEQIEKYFLSVENINSALSYALKRYEICAKEWESPQICCDIANYYHLTKEYDKELLWLEKAVSLADSQGNAEQIILVHEKMLSFYEHRDNSEMAIKENKILESIMSSVSGNRYDKKLEKIYHDLSSLFFKSGNLLQSYFYQMLEEKIIQKSI